MLAAALAATAGWMLSACRHHHCSSCKHVVVDGSWKFGSRETHGSRLLRWNQVAPI
uniref:2Fe-2S iron-sulfur cluster-binding protein n=1 Tax=Paenibacillus sp. FSL W8-0426 TaxID=2921714 RepID=UPI00403F9B30